ncbi:amino acid ABC transporter permease [Fibrobacterales bacterium]|nr:amino acid ABC transporter permease [Fibrobacterales bacterium]
MYEGIDGIRVIFEGINFQRLMVGLLVTLKIAAVSVAVSIPVGVLFGILMTSRKKWVRLLCYFYLDAIRIIPILVLLFVFYFEITRVFKIQWSGEFVAIIVFSMWGIAEMGDLTRGAIRSLPKHQIESALALGLSENAIHRHIIIPQITRRLIPPSINLITRMIKTTPLVALISVIEILKVGQQIIEYNLYRNSTASFWIYGFIFIVYFLLCYPIAEVSRRLEKRWG